MVSGPQFREELKRAKSGDKFSRERHNFPSYIQDGPSYGYPNERTALIVNNTRVSLNRRPVILKLVDGLPPWLHDTSDAVVQVLKTSSVHLLLLLLPFALLSRPLGWSSEVQFVLNFLSIVPLCSIIEFVTEEISMKLGMRVGGLFSATFGNTIEIVFSIVALYYDEIQLVQASLLGDILYNNLFSIGCCFMLGGIQHREQNFNMSIISTTSFIMAVSSITMVVPTTIHFIVEHFSLSSQPPDNTALSRGSAIVMFLIYFAFLNFQLRTHADLFDDENSNQENPEDEEVENVLPIWAAAFVLMATIVGVIFCAHDLIINIDNVVAKTQSSKIFIGFIIIPLLSNTQTTLTAVKVALIDKMDLAIAVTIGSTLQILLFVAPLLILVAWTMGRSLTLSFGILEAVLLLLSSFVAIITLQKGRSTYLDGVLCLGLYVTIAMTMFVYASDTML